ncbi:hypothetical protein FSST1_008274 [Fusarium sambucinum]
MCEGMFGLECWFISAPLRNQRVGLGTSHDLSCWLKQGEFGKSIGGLKGFCVLNSSFDAFHLLYRPSVDLQNLALVQLDQALKKRNRLAPFSPIEKLPLELMSSIYLYLQPTDHIALGLCSRSLWIRAVTTIHHSRRLSSWVDTPMFIGGSRQLLVLRQVIHDQEPELQSPQKGNRDAVRETMILQNPQLLDVLKYARNQSLLHDYASLTSSDLNPPYFRELVRLLPSTGISKSLHVLMESCLLPGEFDDKRQWYLRDFTTNEYIRMELVQDRTISEHDTISLTRNPWMTLDILLIWLITWQAGYDKPSKEVPRGNPRDQIKKIFTNGVSVTAYDIAQIRAYFTDMYYGRWAGHSLDVVQLVQSKMESGWTDITGEIQDVSQQWFVAIYLEAFLLKETKYLEHWGRFARDQINKYDTQPGVY